jgi:hypothetical protein
MPRGGGMFAAVCAVSAGMTKYTLPHGSRRPAHSRGAGANADALCYILRMPRAGSDTSSARSRR